VKNAKCKDVANLLQDVFDRKHLHVECVALVNDVVSFNLALRYSHFNFGIQTVCAALSRAYTAGGCVLGSIFGTGTNGAYLEQVSNITKLGNNPAAVTGGVVMINTEWDAFDNARAVLLRTPEFRRTRSSSRACTSARAGVISSRSSMRRRSLSYSVER